LHIEEPTEAHRPVAHAIHVDAVAAPIALLAVPTAQDAQVDAPADVEYEPAEHGAHASTLAPPMSARANPAIQKLSQNVEPVKFVQEPGGQRRQFKREPTGV
jgi:hypothetical protein